MCLEVQGLTNVSGTISGDAAWTLSGSPYVAIGDITVIEGVPLTIERGVIVKFSSHTSLPHPLIAIG